jgi:hypothetical protein
MTEIISILVVKIFEGIEITEDMLTVEKRIREECAKLIEAVDNDSTCISSQMAERKDEVKVFEGEEKNVQPRCIGLTKKGSRCSKKSVAHGEFCHIHSKVVPKTEKESTVLLYKSVNESSPLQAHHPKISDLMQNTYTITFGDVAENHVGMQKIGALRSHGIDIQTLLDVKRSLEESRKNIKVELHDLTQLTDAEDVEAATILVIREGANVLLEGAVNGTADDLYQEQERLAYDTQALMRGRVVNKKARHNICFGEFDQEPNYAEGRGRVVSFKHVPLLNHLKTQALPDLIGEQAANLCAEGNKYYERKCYIGFHGDTERRIVIAIRLGKSMTLQYQWYKRTQAIGDLFNITLNHGDLYIMSEKATGFDWKKKKIPTLRHAASYQ